MRLRGGCGLHKVREPKRGVPAAEARTGPVSRRPFLQRRLFPLCCRAERGAGSCGARPARGTRDAHAAVRVAAARAVGGGPGAAAQLVPGPGAAASPRCGQWELTRLREELGQDQHLGG